MYNIRLLGGNAECGEWEIEDMSPILQDCHPPRLEKRIRKCSLGLLIAIYEGREATIFSENGDVLYDAKQNASDGYRIIYG